MPPASRMLTQACQTLDRAEGLADRIAEDSDIIRTPTGIKAHPGIREELAARGLSFGPYPEVGLNFQYGYAGPKPPKVISCPTNRTPLNRLREARQSTPKRWRCSLS